MSNRKWMIPLRLLFYVSFSIKNAFLSQIDLYLNSAHL